MAIVKNKQTMGNGPFKMKGWSAFTKTSPVKSDPAETHPEHHETEKEEKVTNLATQAAMANVPHDYSKAFGQIGEGISSGYTAIGKAIKKALGGE